MTRWKLFIAIALVAVAAVHFSAVPRSIWEFDENLFAAAVEHHEPLRHNPPPPGCPLYIGFGKLVAVVTPDAFTALVATSCIAVIVGFLAFVLAFSAIVNGAPASSPAGRAASRRPADDGGAGRRRASRRDAGAPLAGALLLYLCPALLISGTLPQQDAGALALFGFAIWACTRRTPILAGLLCAIAIGWRLQFSVAIVPMFLATLVMMRTWRDRIIATGVFGLTCLAWFVPLVFEAGGSASYWTWLSGQAKYYAQHDADLSRSGHSAAHIALRFVAHPWGAKWLSIPLLGLAIAGIRRNPRLIPLACGSLVYLAFALATMDPADAVRYAIPSLPLVALLAATALSEWSAGLRPADVAARDAGAPIVAILYAIGSIWYAYPLLHQRATSLSPPAAAIRWIEKNVPKNAIVLYDAPLWPHSSYLLRGWNTMRVDAGLAQHGGDATTPMVIFADSELGNARGVTFRWPDTDAYRKLTRQHYGAVSAIPLPPAQRYRVIEGVFAPERTRDGRAWRWIGGKAIIELPQLGATRVRLTFRTPPEYPLDGNRIRVNDAVVELKRNDTADVIVPIADQIIITPERTFVPAKIRGANNRDARALSVMLTGVEQIDPQRNATQSPPAQ